MTERAQLALWEAFRVHAVKLLPRSRRRCREAQRLTSRRRGGANSEASGQEKKSSFSHPSFCSLSSSRVSWCQPGPGPAAWTGDAENSVHVRRRPCTWQTTERRRPVVTGAQCAPPRGSRARVIKRLPGPGQLQPMSWKRLAQC